MTNWTLSIATGKNMESWVGTKGLFFWRDNNEPTSPLKSKEGVYNVQGAWYASSRIHDGQV